MDNHENEIMNDEILQDPVVIPEGPETIPAPPAEETPAPQVYHNVGTGRKESPFADSPFVNVYEQPATAAPVETPAETTPAPRKSGKVWKKLVAAVLAVALVGGSCAATASVVNEYWEARMTQMNADVADRINSLEQELKNRLQQVENNGTSVSGSPNVTAEGLTPGQVYAQNVMSTVMVYSAVTQRGQLAYSTGSGFVLTADGYVVTNYHVVEGGETFTVVTADKVEHEATFVGGDASNDIAVLKVAATGLRPATVGSSDALIVGDQVAAIGNPLGELTSTLTVGYVSGKGRYVTTESTTINMIQTDCAINSGNSGGPLFNMKGEVVGITTAKYSGNSSSGASIEGIGFAIPIDDVIGIVEDLIEFGYPNGGYLGIEVNNQNELTAGLPSGAYVANVTPGYCAEKAGIQPGDYIVELGGHTIETMTDLTRILRRMDPGTTTTVTVLRGNLKITLEITLDERPRQTVEEEQPSQQMPMPEEGNYEEWYEYFFGKNG